MDYLGVASPVTCNRPNPENDYYTEYRLEIAVFLVLLFSILTLVSSVEIWLLAGDTASLPSFLSWLENLASGLGGWASWVVIIAPIGLIISGWWLYDFFRKTRKLTGLIDTTSKAKFVRNQDDIEYLAWSLPQRYEDKVISKKREFKL
jgi:hypothetical protein